MRARTGVVIAVVAALSLVALTGVALASGAVGSRGWMGGMGRGVYHGAQGTPAASCPMAGGSGRGSYGPGGMMGGYQGGQPTPAATPAVGVTRVNIQSFAFQPQTIQVARGTTVTWTNQDGAPHTVTFRSGGMTGSDALQRGQSFSYTFTTAGTYAYYCGAHPYMTGTVIVTP